MGFRLRVLEGPLRGATYHLRDVFLLGRSGACDLPILDRRVSRLHARVSRNAAGEHVLTDLGSANGTRVNRAPVGERRLAPGDEIAVGGVRLVYERRPVEVPPPDDLLDDVIAYRSLAATVIRGEKLDAAALERLRELDHALRDAADPEQFLELPFAGRARLRSAWGEDGEGAEVRMCALGPGSATVYTPPRRLVLEDVVHLVFDRPVALTGVVVAVGPVLCSLSFSMCTGWAERMSPLQRAPTLRMRVPVGLRVVS